MEQNSPSFSYCRCSMKHIFEVQLHCMRMRFFRFSYGNCINSWLFFSLSLLTEQQLSIFLLMFENKFRPNFCIQIHKISWKFPYKNACKRFYLPFLWIFRGCSVQMTKIFFFVCSCLCPHGRGRLKDVHMHVHLIYAFILCIVFKGGGGFATLLNGLSCQSLKLGELVHVAVGSTLFALMVKDSLSTVPILLVPIDPKLHSSLWYKCLRLYLLELRLQNKN